VLAVRHSRQDERFQGRRCTVKQDVFYNLFLEKPVTHLSGNGWLLVSLTKSHVNFVFSIVAVHFGRFTEDVVIGSRAQFI
jgi:hypothetical protein